MNNITFLMRGDDGNSSKLFQRFLLHRCQILHGTTQYMRYHCRKCDSCDVL